jgi:hypothetical protein
MSVGGARWSVKTKRAADIANSIKVLLALHAVAVATDRYLKVRPLTTAQVRRLKLPFFSKSS